MAFQTIGKGTQKNGNPGRPNPKLTYVVLIRTCDLKTKPVKDEDGVSCSTDIDLKPGCLAACIYATPSTIKVGDKSTGDADKKGFITTLEFEFPGTSVEYSQFMNDNVNENLMAVVIYPDLGFHKMLGGPGNPMQLSHEQKDDEKEDSNIVKLETLFAGDKYLLFTGKLPVVDNEALIPGIDEYVIPFITTELSELLTTEAGEIILY